MAKGPVTDVQATEDAVLIVIQRRTLDESATNELVDDVLMAAAAHPGPPIVLDMSQVKFAPSVALGSLVRLSKSFRLDNRRLILINVDRRTRGAIAVTRLDKVLEIFNTLEDALKSSSK